MVVMKERGEKLRRGFSEVLRPTPGRECLLDSSGNSLMERVSSVTGIINSLFIIRRASFAVSRWMLVVGTSNKSIYQPTNQSIKQSVI